MKKYQIVEVKEKFQHAGSKAREDVALFAQQAGFMPLYIRCRKQINDGVKERLLRYVLPGFSWMAAFLKIKRGAMVVIQNPFYHRQLGRKSCLKWLKSVKKCTIVSVVHDAEFLRGEVWGGANLDAEFSFMKENSDFIIVHNNSMKKAFEEIGIASERLVPLGIFDYATESVVTEKKCDADIVVAGNLAPDKSTYVYLFKNVQNAFSVKLYGPNYADGGENENVKYMGSFPPEEVPNVLDGKFGLIWDGDSLDCCAGQTGNYLRYNNPHKTSLYLVAGLPVVIWKEAAMARFVEAENVGITIHSVSEIKQRIEALSNEEYNAMRENAKRISDKLKSGYYLKTALAKCESVITER